MNWSGGKDSALALHRVLEAGEMEVTCLLTTVNETYRRISMHGVRTELLEMQADRLGIPLRQVVMPADVDMAGYDAIMTRELERLKGEGVTHGIFGDIFLEDLRKYREEKLASVGMEGCFPLWQRPTGILAREFSELQFRAVVVCVDKTHLDDRFVGRDYSWRYVKDLPLHVDPCGEYGEFHTFVYDGPIFREPVDFDMGEKVERSYRKTQDNRPHPHEEGDDRLICPPSPPSQQHPGFWYCDLLPLTSAGPGL